ncbi:MAG: histidine phosphotransferase family protein [Caulobacteraceae bacterium]
MALAARVALALCHDFAGPLGAVTLGLDLLAEEVGGLAGSEAWPVIGDGLRALDSRLTFARAAYGASKDTATTGDIEHAARALLAGSKVELVWRVGRPILPPSVGGLLLHLAQLGLSALPRGGVVAVSVEERPASLRLLVEAKGPFARLKSGTPEGLSGAAPPPGPAADWTRAAYARAVVLAMGGSVSGQSGEGWVSLAADLPRAITSKVRA